MKIRNMGEKMKPLRDVSPVRSWEKVAARQRRRKIRVLFEFSKYAAIVILAIFAGSLLHRGKTPVQNATGITEIYVPLGQMSQVTLPDSSRVWLNSGTTLRYANHFGTENREVSLQGEAFFKVKHSGMPFRVKLKKSEVEVLGTSFNVVSFNNDPFSEVTLVEGKVKINDSSGREVVNLKPSEQIRLSDDLKNNSLKKVNTGFFTSWTEGKIVFEEERLAEIIPQLQRWYNVEIRLSDEAIGNYRFSGTILKNKPVDQIVKAFSLLLPVHIQYTNNLNKKDTVFISKK
jgi:ferric-dicitrate binding protein FerR (iron transport regulator)